MMRFRRICSSSGIRSARDNAWATSCSLFGFTMRASRSSFAAPAISLRMRTPRPSCFVARYSFATRFIPSRSGVMSATSAEQ